MVLTSPLRLTPAEALWFIKPTGNLDDFNVRNVRLLLGDGTEIRDPLHSDPTVIYDLGDDGRFLPYVTFNFEIPSDKITALSHTWDTSMVSDGEHRIQLNVKGQPEAHATVQVDNNGPSITASVEEGKSYKGSFLIDVSAVQIMQVKQLGTPVEDAIYNLVFTM